MKSSRSTFRRLVRNIATFYNQSQSSCRVLVGVSMLADAYRFYEFCENWASLTITCLIGFTTAAIADEGMWLFNAPPLKQLKEKYQFRADTAVARASAKSECPFQLRRQRLIRFRKRTRASRIITSAPIRCRRSAARRTTIVRDGFYAKTQAEEIKRDRSRAERPDVDRRCNGAGKCAR